MCAGAGLWQRGEILPQIYLHQAISSRPCQDHFAVVVGFNE